MTVSSRIRDALGKASWIRRMFEEGRRLKAELGEDQVVDLSLGNPCLEPPARLKQALRDCAADDRPGLHRYPPNAGLTETRQAVARRLSGWTGAPVSAERLVITCGAAGGLNITLKSLLDPGDEVLILVPYFPEYPFYITNHQGVTVPVPCQQDFSLDLETIERYITPKTRALILNSPNNPTGRMVSQGEMTALCELLGAQERPIFLLLDEPYRHIVYPPHQIAEAWPEYDRALIIGSFSKDLGIPGERIGWVAVHPELEEGEVLVRALSFANRTLGFVNAPAFLQRVVAACGDSHVDLELYQRNRDLIGEGLRNLGLPVPPLQGAFYAFPQSPIPDDVAFVRALQEERVLTVPGVGFGHPGHFRVSYCVPTERLERALEGFERAMRRVGTATC